MLRIAHDLGADHLALGALSLIGAIPEGAEIMPSEKITGSFIERIEVERLGDIPFVRTRPRPEMCAVQSVMVAIAERIRRLPDPDAVEIGLITRVESRGIIRGAGLGFAD